MLDRRHTPGRAVAAVDEAHAAGFEHVSLDLIYGTPGETAQDWTASLTAAIAAGPDHISAYALVVEDGTRLAVRVRRGEIPAPDDDVLADRYVAADDALHAAGYEWYEISNWAASPAARCAHNEGYWRGADWWGIGPGAHSHVGGVRWWNVRHPTPYAEAVSAGRSPAAGREVLDAAQRHAERVLLELRMVDGLRLDVLDITGAAAARRAVDDKLLEGPAYDSGYAVLTREGRLLADRVARDLLP
jgi:oxygen-independent coproporphyrinogen-3 oxidase